MEIIQNEIQKINLNLPLKSSLVVVGYFDGLHYYHQKLLNLAQKTAQSQNLKLILVTFDQKITAYLSHNQTDLIAPDTKLKLLTQQLNLDYLIELKVNQHLINLSPQKFIQFLEKNLGTKMMVEGADFCFGAQCTGNLTTLSNHFGAKNVVVVKRKKAVSTTKIRKLLAKGKIRKINLMLRRSLELNLTCTLSPNQGEKWTINYPKTKIAPGFYQIADEQNHQLIVKIGAKKNLKVVKNLSELSWEPGVYQFKFKKFLGQEK